MEHHQQGCYPKSRHTLEVEDKQGILLHQEQGFNPAILSLLYQTMCNLSANIWGTSFWHVWLTKKVLVLVFISSPHCHESLTSPCLTPCALLFCCHLVLLCASLLVFFWVLCTVVYTFILDLCLSPVLFVCLRSDWSSGFDPHLPPLSVYICNFPLSSRSLVISVNLFYMTSVEG